ncbi:uncharacterized protein [Pseudorasbora parva]|uniref:uncharacterized protein isoform X1 n=1 Tax=Pseudorasbora parva TaxID=51549 RepID=UPI00351F7478
MTAIENCSEDSVTTASTSRITVEPPCKDDDNMTAIENCSEDSVTTASTSRFTAEPLVDYSDSDDGVVCSKNMNSYKKRSVIRDDSDDLFENSSVNSDDDHTDIQNDIRRNRAPFAISEQHSACTTTSKRAKNTRARWKIAEYSDGSSEDELSVSEEEYIPDTSESYTSNSGMSFTASPKGYVKKTDWNKHEIQAVEAHMMRFINNRKIPGKADCMRCKEAELALKNREWSTLKFYIKNLRSKQKRSDTLIGTLAD